MKKLMIAAAIVCAAAVSQAAVANWSAGASEIYDGTGAESYATGTAMFFDAGTMSQSALFALFAAGTEIGSGTAGYVSEATLSSGAVSKKFEWGTQGDGKTYNYYFAIVGADKIYLSNIVGAESPASSSAKSVLFGDQYNWDDPTALPNSQALPTEGYVGAGQWAANVPEPTSGLLLLLGMAGLALRRRRA